jgi:hypothetical protein
MKIKKRLSILIAFILLISIIKVNAGTWTILDFPGAEGTTRLTGINGGKIFGYYGTVLNRHGCIYDGSTWTTFDVPEATTTQISGLSGNIIVGNCTFGTFPSRTSYFIYDGISFEILTDTHSNPFHIYHTNGNIIAAAGGYYDISTSTWVGLNYPPSEDAKNNTIFYDVDGTNLIGAYFENDYLPESPFRHGAIYNLNTQTWTVVDAPEATSTTLHGMSNNKIIGNSNALNTTYFIYDGTNWITDLPGLPVGISGNTVVGMTGLHGYVYTIPEPCTIALLSFGGLLLRSRKE